MCSRAIRTFSETEAGERADVVREWAMSAAALLAAGERTSREVGVAFNDQFALQKILSLPCLHWADAVEKAFWGVTSKIF
jgi:hypothetical protein